MTPARAPPATSMRLQALRQLMKTLNIQAYYIPSEDAHQSEYIAEWDGRRQFISGFTGSAGYAIVTGEKAALWTDGRYFLQAAKQLDSNWTLMKAGLPETKSKEEWLAHELNKGDRLGVDSHVISFENAKKLYAALAKKGISLVLEPENLVDKVWSDRPPVSLQPIFSLPLEFCGLSSRKKIEAIRSGFQEDCYGFLASALDEVGWLFNLRGSDIKCNPNFFSYALVCKDKSVLYTNQQNLTKDANEALKEEGVEVKSYKDIFSDMRSLKDILEAKKERLMISGSCNAALVTALTGEKCCDAIEEVEADFIKIVKSPVAYAKAIKNATEIEGFRNCHKRDGLALVKYFAWLENALRVGGEEIDEVDGAEKLLEFRSQGKYFKGISFDTISGAGANGAIIHYKPEKPSAAKITLDQMYLCDSGGQYLDGTTDVTRTLHFGTPTAQERECFTRVLKGQIAVGSAVFPKGCSGFQLDILARMHLWRQGLDYRHGTGHGVGHFLNVHEGPQSISPHPNAQETKLEPGMTVTNEPGFYLDGKFGIRIEDVLIVRDVETVANFGGMQFRGFENVTMAPICLNLIEKRLLDANEIKWVNDYHYLVYSTLAPLISEDDSITLAWLKKETVPL